MERRLKVTMMVILCGFLIISLLGCVTSRGREGDLYRQSLRNQIQVLQSQLKQKDEEIATLREALDEQIKERQELVERLNRQAPIKSPIAEVKSRPSAKQIQTALKNAGYNPGPIDGRMGRRTKEAIRSFQRANGLVVDGRVGKQTWELLKKYLYTKTK